jgi:hypothetical protein
MIEFFVKMGLGVIGGAVAGPLAPLGGAAGYAFGEFLFDKQKDYLEPEELFAKYAVKLAILTAGGAVGGLAGELLGSTVGASLDGLSEMIVPGDVSENVAKWLLENPTVANSFYGLCNLTADSCLSEEAKAALINTYFDQFGNVIQTLISDDVMDEMIGRETVKRLVNKPAQQLLEQLFEQFESEVERSHLISQSI